MAGFRRATTASRSRRRKIDLRSLVRPQGPRRATTYWLRRLSTAALVAAAAFVGYEGDSLWSTVQPVPVPGSLPIDSPSPVTTAAPTTTPSIPRAAQTSPSPASGAAPATPAQTGSASAVAEEPRSAETGCVPELRFSLAADASTTGPGGSVDFTIDVANDRPFECQAVLENDDYSLVVTTEGGIPIWSSSSCKVGFLRNVSLAPSGTQRYELAWDRSAAATGCGRRIVPAGTYVAVLQVGKQQSMPVVVNLR